MGGKPTIIRETVQDPQMAELLIQLQHQNAELHAKFMEIMQSLRDQGLDKKIESFEDLKRYDQKGAEALVKLAIQTKPLKMEGRNFGFFGLTSTGKSSIINSLIGKYVAEVGAGETTLKPQSYKAQNYTLHDIPGRNDELSYFSMEYISFWKGLTGRIVVITTTIKEMTKVLHLLDAIGVPYEIVVNKFDNVPERERVTFKTKIINEIKALGLKGARKIWFLSAQQPKLFSDWSDMTNYLNAGSSGK